MRCMCLLRVEEIKVLRWHGFYQSSCFLNKQTNKQTKLLDLEEKRDRYRFMLVWLHQGRDMPALEKYGGARLEVTSTWPDLPVSAFVLDVVRQSEVVGHRSPFSLFMPRLTTATSHLLSAASGTQQVPSTNWWDADGLHGQPRRMSILKPLLRAIVGICLDLFSLFPHCCFFICRKMQTLLDRCGRLPPVYSVKCPPCFHSLSCILP